jgi:lipoyl(octanoyl) transferase
VNGAPEDPGDSTTRPSLHVMTAGVMPYSEALELQRSLARQRIAGEIAHDVLLLVEHPHVVTLGRAYKGATLTVSADDLRARGVEVFEVERGGDVTYHGPGQLVGYPVFDLKRHRQDLHWYLRQVEEALIVALRTLGIEGWRNTGYTGVWVGPAGKMEDHPGSQITPGSRTAGGARKIASIGVHARDWVTWHGFALNVTTDLSFFDLMVPCGIEHVSMTSVARERPDVVTSVQEMGHLVADSFAKVFDHLNAPVSLGGGRSGT